MAILNDIERKFPWSFLGCVAGVVFGLFGIYTVFFYDKFPDLKIETTSDAPVFSVKEQVPELDILFQKTNIREAHQGLSIVTLRINNQGKSPIRASDFDVKDPLTVSLLNGKIIRADMVDSSEDYFKNVFTEAKTSDSKIILPPFIMERGRYMAIRVLVLHDEKVRPKFSATGKIANIKELTITPYTLSEPVSVIHSTIQGDVVVQGLRVLVYGGGLIAAIGLIAVIMNFISSAFRRRRERKQQERLEDLVTGYLQKMPLDLQNQLRPFTRLCMKNDILHYIKYVFGEGMSENWSGKVLHLLLSDMERIDPEFQTYHLQLTPEIKKHLINIIEYIKKNM